MALSHLPEMNDFSSLPVVTSCAGCGACCSFQGAPPDYVALRLNPHFADDPSFADDLVRLNTLPDAARALLDQFLAESAHNPHAVNDMCVWYDLVSESCQFYEWRPSTCRVFELSGPGCHLYRRLRAVQGAPTEPEEGSRL